MFGPWTPEAFVRATPWSASARGRWPVPANTHANSSRFSAAANCPSSISSPTAIRAVSSSSRSSAGVRASATTDRSESRSDRRGQLRAARAVDRLSQHDDIWVAHGEETRRDIYKGCPSGDRCRIRPSGVCLLQRRVERLLLKSAFMSSTCSIPTDTRMRPSVSPAASRSSRGSRRGSSLPAARSGSRRRRATPRG